MGIEKYIILTDHQLVTMSMDGDAVALEHLFDRYRESVFQIYLQKTGGNKEDADDLIQETFIKVYLNLGKYNPSYTFGQWVYTIARNTFIDFLRKRHDNLSIDSQYTSTSKMVPASSLPDPEETIINSQRRLQLEKHLEKMTPKYRKLIELRFFKDYSYEEISAELQIPMGTVKAQIHRAREQLCRFIIEHSDILP